MTIINENQLKKEIRLQIQKEFKRIDTRILRLNKELDNLKDRLDSQKLIIKWQEKNQENQEE